MKRNAITRIIIWSIVIVVLLSIMFTVMFGINWKRTHYAQATLVPVEEATAPALTSDAIVLEAADIYTAPNTEATRVGTLNAGASVEFSRGENVGGIDWVYIVSPEAGWVQAEYIATDVLQPESTAETATVTVELNVRSSPSTMAAAITMLEPGVKVAVKTRETINGTDWAFITSPTQGWVVAAYLADDESAPASTDPAVAADPAASAETATVTDDLNVRSSPSPEAAVIGMLERGEQVAVKTRETINGIDWAFITSPTQGWVVAAYLTEATSTAATQPATASTQPTASAEGQQMYANEVSVDAREVQDIEIEWVAGSIIIQPKDIDQIVVCEDGLSDQEYAMVWKHRNGKLSIQFCEDTDFSFNFGISINTQLSKDLIIYVPFDWVCNSLEIDAASASVEINDLTIREVEFDGASGTCEFDNCTVDKLDLDTASGDVRFTGSLQTLDCDAASANVYAELTNVPDRIDMDSASGDLELCLPSDAGFTVTMDGLSTDFNSDFETTMRNGSYVCGDGSCRINMDGMSGDIIIHKAP